MKENHKKQEPLIWSSVVRSLTNPLMEHDLDPASLYRDSGISADEVLRVDGEVPLKNWLKFLELAAEHADNPILGIHLARAAGPETLGAIGFLFLSSKNVLEALENLCHYMNLLQGVTFAQVTRDKHETAFVYEIMYASDNDCRQDVEFSLALTKRQIRIFSGGQAKVLRINFKHSPQCDPRLYERQLKTSVFFNQDENSVVLPSSANMISGKILDNTLAPILKTYLDRELKTVTMAMTFCDQIERLLYANRIDPPITAKKVAFQMGVSEPTLYRRLAAEGRKFSSMLDAYHFEQAKEYLDTSSLSVTEIAHMLGFADSASFSRAFSRWSEGTAPSRYRTRD
ncbi:AraC family transcriptional regulator [Kordiimonas laminariae]|uniref:AraC family transcriptional regulator n=1 Tax=Kordiimonas laminariae TaxID=2917717 RepID=UPI001FF5787F|nr:AraC family transcriptional regulator [Kordiimonas laminariae]